VFIIFLKAFAGEDFWLTGGGVKLRRCDGSDWCPPCCGLWAGGGREVLAGGKFLTEKEGWLFRVGINI
jgi:hypothetical protein